ncbi:MAG TPA: DedA family protein, partial [Myxococcaceae bacterium]|nr:DedA family protein [Myxococcaceae bacterium]
MQSEGVAAYLVIFGVLVACGLGVPLPEDISLVTGGFLAYLEVANLFVMMGVGFVGILCGDSVIFLAGRRFG